ncbi:MAG: glycoside hydrolase family 88 protein [Bacteroides sp.]|nr:glycoside hydrolase family 88 protein [Bacteroides sp.]
MKKRVLLLAVSAALIFTGCRKETDPSYNWVRKGIETATAQLLRTSGEVAHTGMLPRSIWVGYDMDFLCAQLERDPATFKDSLRVMPVEKLGERRLCHIYDWTSGFYPGTLWYLYELTGNPELLRYATHFTNLLYPVREYTGTHDLGFMIHCSFGNAARLAPHDSIAPILVQTADNLISRFDPEIGCIRSWDFGWWNFPVIIDNMMNLDLLFEASRITGNPKYREVGIKHALVTMKHHFRPDHSSYHVVSYHNDGTVEAQETHQGKNHESSWARGQAWALYGYISCYQETSNPAFLKKAEDIARFIMERVTTEDLIPYWDYDAPDTPETPRDASAASVTASALIALSTLVSNGEVYLTYAETLLKNLSSPDYLARPGENQGFILMHSTGSLPNGSEIDTPLNYADYYYLEALKRYVDLKKLTI